jgi:hypothetical protein
VPSRRNAATVRTGGFGAQQQGAVHRAYGKRVDDKAASANAQLNARTQPCFGGRLLEVLLAKKEW